MPYWNMNLSQLWKDMHEKEKLSRKYKGDGNRKLILKNKFVQVQKKYLIKVYVQLKEIIIEIH